MFCEISLDQSFPHSYSYHRHQDGWDIVVTRLKVRFELCAQYPQNNIKNVQQNESNRALGT